MLAHCDSPGLVDTNSSIPPYGPNPTPNLRYYSFTQGAASAPEQVSDPVSQPATYSQIGAVHKRPKFTAKEQRSPSPRTSQEAPGADPPIANRKNAGTRKNSGTVPEFYSNRAIDKGPKFTAKAQSSPSPRTRKEAPGADPPIANRKNSGTVPEFFHVSLVPCFRYHQSESGPFALGVYFAKRWIFPMANAISP